MIIWSGSGLLIALICALVVVTLNAIFPNGEEFKFLLMALSALLTGLIWFAFLKMAASLQGKVNAAKQVLENPDAADEKTLKQASQQVKAEPFVHSALRSSLFFIPGRWWPYLLFVLSIVLLVLHFVN